MKRRVLFVVCVVVGIVPMLVNTAPDIAAAQISVDALGFGPLFALNTDAAEDDGTQGTPDLASDGLGTIVAVWDQTREVREFAAAHSTDNGSTWSQTYLVTRNVEGLVSLATDSAGTWLAVYAPFMAGTPALDGSFDIATSGVALSTDMGVTWGRLGTAPLCGVGYNLVASSLGIWITSSVVSQDEQPISNCLPTVSRDSGTSWEYVQISGLSDGPPSSGIAGLANDGAGNWVALYTDADGSIGSISRSDMAAIRSSDGGMTWSESQQLNLPGTFADFPQVGTDGKGRWVGVWSELVGSEQKSLVVMSDNNGETWSDAQDPGIELSGEVLTDGIGNWLMVRAQSASETEGPTTIIIARSKDNGATWTEHEILTVDQRAITDPRVLPAANGRWLLVFESIDDLDGTVGTDSDILISISDDLDAKLTPPIVACSPAADASLHSGIFPPTLTGDLLLLLGVASSLMAAKGFRIRHLRSL